MQLRNKKVQNYKEEMEIEIDNENAEDDDDAN